MAHCWVPDVSCECLHPGGAALLQGRAAVLKSFEDMFENVQRGPYFDLSHETLLMLATPHDDGRQVGHVTQVEKVNKQFHVSSINSFVSTGSEHGVWKMTCHHTGLM